MSFSNILTIFPDSIKFYIFYKKTTVHNLIIVKYLMIHFDENVKMWPVEEEK